ncbi:MAG: nascent polypeptide-associated complex protein [Candidatus Bathyarchaeota archaeon B23]|nr:MAG: nascent polypeptide-associated complex protein [Candidatus Bathyarchaeota archaeon B23]
MKQMGLKMDALTDVEEVIIRGRDREIVIEEPVVTLLDVKGERVYQITGGRVREKERGRRRIPEEDILLVAQQAGVTLEEARRALEEAEGDLAKAILMLKTS